MENKIYKKKGYINKKYFNDIICLEDSVVYHGVKHLASVVYGEGFTDFNILGKTIEEGGKQIRGNHYSFFKET